MTVWRVRSRAASAGRTATVLPAPAAPGREGGARPAHADGLAAAALAGDHADAALGDAPADAGEGFVVRGVAVQHARRQVAPERHPGETVIGDQFVYHRGWASWPVSRSSCPGIWSVPDRAA